MLYNDDETLSFFESFITWCVTWILGSVCD